MNIVAIVKDFWALLLILAAILGLVAKTSIKVDRLTRQIQYNEERSKSHDTRLKTVEKKVETVEHELGHINDDWNTVKEDLAVIRLGIVASLDGLNQLGAKGEVLEARDKIMNNLVHK